MKKKVIIGLVALTILGQAGVLILLYQFIKHWELYKKVIKSEDIYKWK